MSKQFIRLLAAAAFALLIQANFLPANAAAASNLINCLLILLLLLLLEYLFF